MRNLIKTFSFALAFACAGFTQAATWTWTGSTSNSWDVKANWNTVSASSRPQSGDLVIINSGATNQPRLVNNRTIKTLILNGGTLDLRDYDLTVNDTVQLRGGNLGNSSSNTANITTNYVILNAVGASSMTSSDVINFTVNRAMVFVNGIFTTNANNLIIIANNAVVSGYSNASHINGPVRKVGDDAFVFPIGNSGLLAPIGISDFSNSSTSQHHTAQYFYTAPSGTLSGGGRISQREYWTVQRSASNRTTRYTLYFNQHQRSGRITDSTDLAVAVNNGSTWSPITSTLSGNRSAGSLLTNNRVAGTIQGITISSPLGINALPVKLSEYYVSNTVTGALINWKTVSESNNHYFTIEKSLDGVNWSEIGQVEGNNNSTTVKAYQFADANLVSGVQYYRLSQTDFNGKTETFSVLIFNNHVKVSLSMFPNPAHDRINISADSDVEQTAVVINAQGQELANFTFSGSYVLNLDGYENGVYSVIVNQSQTFRFVKN